MSWLGKIMTWLVLIGSVVWGYFTVNAYVTRVNWKTRADTYEKAFKESEAAREKEFRDNQLARAAAMRMYVAERDRADQAQAALDNVQAASRKVDKEYKEIEEKLIETKTGRETRDARLKTFQDEIDNTRKRNALLEDKLVAQILEREKAERARVEAVNEAKFANALAAENAKKIEELTALVTDLKQTGGVSGVAAVNRAINKVPAPLPENIRGTVTRDMVDGLVQISIGIDAGLDVGSRLDVYRETGEGKYLGTLVVTKSLYPKEAVATFIPARAVPISQLRPDELPRKNDTVGKLR